MAKGQGKTKLIVTIVVLALTLIVVGGLAFLQSRQPAADTATDTPTTSEEVVEEEEPETTPPVDEQPEPVIDPATMSTLDIEPMGITIAYTKGTPGFEFQVVRNGQGTQSVVFSSPDLIGTKCTDDSGRFASIIKDPKTEDEATVTQTKTVDNITYGLSLPDDTCTGNVELLKEYQGAFTDGFSLLKAME